MSTKMKTRKVKVIGFPDEKGIIRYVLLDAATGSYIEGQCSAMLQVNDETGERTVQVAIDCSDITMLGVAEDEKTV